MPTAVLYCRVSSDEQAQKDISIPAQRKLLTRWVDERPEWTVAAEFKDEGESAYAPADKRPGFREMISFCKKHRINAILVHKLDRFSRHREESILFKSMLRKHGVIVKSITENFDPDTPQGFLYEGMIEVINQFYSMNLATETMKGMTENAERGHFNGGPVPYGYRVERFTDERGREHGRLVHGPEEEVATVRRIYDLSVNQGMGVRSVANELNRLGIPGPRSPHWNSGSINTILNNETYTGDTIWNKTRKVGRDGREDTADSDRIVVRGTHPAIIDRELFDRRHSDAQKRMFAAPASPRLQHVEYLLSRLIRCENCGSHFCGRKMNNVINRKGDKKPAYAYYCGGYMNKGPSVCASLPLRKEWVEGVVVDTIRSRITQPQALEELSRMCRARVEAHAKSFAADSRALEGKLADIERKIQNYMRAIGDGIDPSMCRQQIAELTARREELEGQARAARKEDYVSQTYERNIEVLRRLAGAVEGDFAALPLHAQRQVVLHFVADAAIVNRETLRLDLHIPFEFDGVRKLADELSGTVRGPSHPIGDTRRPAVGSVNREPFHQRYEPRNPVRGSRLLPWRSMFTGNRTGNALGPTGNGTARRPLREALEALVAQQVPHGGAALVEFDLDPIREQLDPSTHELHELTLLGKREVFEGRTEALRGRDHRFVIEVLGLARAQLPLGSRHGRAQLVHGVLGVVEQPLRGRARPDPGGQDLAAQLGRLVLGGGDVTA